MLAVKLFQVNNLKLRIKHKIVFSTVGIIVSVHCIKKGARNFEPHIKGFSSTFEDNIAQLLQFCIWMHPYEELYMAYVFSRFPLI